MSAQRAWSARVFGFYRTHERWMGVMFFLGGIAWDLLTLRRIDNWVDNTILLTYFGVLGVIIGVHGALVGSVTVPAWMEKTREWIPLAIQFVLGALLSAFVIFYARSVTWTSGTAFWVALVIGLLGNEVMHRRKTSFAALTVTYFAVGATLAAYLVPVVAGRLGLDLFRVALAVALIPAGTLMLYGFRVGAFETRARLGLTILSIFLLGNMLDVGYRNNWIPPVPLSLRHGGIYEQVARDGDDFLLSYHTDISGRWLPGLFSPDYARRVHWAPGDTVFAFSAIFAPTGLRQRMVHSWQRQDSTGWTLVDDVSYEVRGGRDEGYRGTTFKRRMKAGNWRVVVQTADGRVLSRIPFEIIEGGEPPSELRTLRR